MTHTITPELSIQADLLTTPHTGEEVRGSTVTTEGGEVVRAVRTALIAITQLRLVNALATIMALKLV